MYDKGILYWAKEYVFFKYSRYFAFMDAISVRCFLRTNIQIKYCIGEHNNWACEMSLITIYLTCTKTFMYACVKELMLRVGFFDGTANHIEDLSAKIQQRSQVPYRQRTVFCSHNHEYVRVYIKDGKHCCFQCFVRHQLPSAENIGLHWDNGIK